MKYILLILLSFNAFAEIKYTRLDADGNNQGEFIVESEDQGNARILKMLKVKRSWMKCDWKVEAHESDIKRVESFMDEEGTEIEITTYCHPKTFSIVKEDITDLLAAKKAKKDQDEADLAELQIKYDDETIKLGELIKFLKLKGI